MADQSCRIKRHSAEPPYLLLIEERWEVSLQGRLLVICDRQQDCQASYLSIEPGPVDVAIIEGLVRQHLQLK